MGRYTEHKEKTGPWVITDKGRAACLRPFGCAAAAQGRERCVEWCGNPNCPATSGVPEALKVDAACPQHGTPPQPSYRRLMHLPCCCGVSPEEIRRRATGGAYGVAIPDGDQHE